MEMDLKVDEYLTGEKHQLGRHVTMLVIMLLTIIVVSALKLFSLRIQLSLLAPRSSPLGTARGRDSAEILRHQFGISVVETQGSFPLASDTSGSIHILSGEEQGENVFAGS